MVLIGGTGKTHCNLAAVPAAAAVPDVEILMNHDGTSLLSFLCVLAAALLYVDFALRRPLRAVHICMRRHSV